MDIETITPDAEESAMRDLGVETDAAHGQATAETPQETPIPEPTDPVERVETEPPPQDTSEPPEPEQIAARQPERDINGQFKRSERPETEYSRAQKEQARKDRSWQALQAEKEQLRAQQAHWEEQQRMAQLETERRNFQPLKKEGLTAQEYYQGAVAFERDGDHENALKAYKVASEMRHVEQQRYQQHQQVEREYHWRQQLQYVKEREPNVFDPNTPIGAHVQRIVNGNPELYNLPGGFLRAAEFALMLTQVEQAKEKDDEIIALKAQLEKFQRKGQPARGGHASPRTTDKEFDDLNLDEMESHLKHLTAEADSFR